MTFNTSMDPDTVGFKHAEAFLRDRIAGTEDCNPKRSDSAFIGIHFAGIDARQAILRTDAFPNAEQRELSKPTSDRVRAAATSYLATAIEFGQRGAELQRQLIASHAARPALVRAAL